ncbi:hypothetical protein L211DRAFT_408504 [Terfezia boudieri ATCC MYA-4762]|uniref:Uncharacterized protein n=1 Tax=Terfezia boudieri ATCC MYA-4762 TaxID=1051890 RepID=A0A3N4LG45_9PEZI|nr:hypothetical protein L211DRAFT_408504 [Terfezia boudieri ATCC MYA-4762]
MNNIDYCLKPGCYSRLRTEPLKKLLTNRTSVIPAVHCMQALKMGITRYAILLYKMFLFLNLPAITYGRDLVSNPWAKMKHFPSSTKLLS